MKVEVYVPQRHLIRSAKALVMRGSSGSFPAWGEPLVRWNGVPVALSSNR